MRKFKVGDVIVPIDSNSDEWPKRLVISSHDAPFGYRVTIEDTTEKYRYSIGLKVDLTYEAASKHWKLDPSYLACKQFDNELARLLEE